MKKMLFLFQSHHQFQSWCSCRQHVGGMASRPSRLLILSCFMNVVYHISSSLQVCICVVLLFSLELCVKIVDSDASYRWPEQYGADTFLQGAWGQRSFLPSIITFWVIVCLNDSHVVSWNGSHFNLLHCIFTFSFLVMKHIILYT